MSEPLEMEKYDVRGFVGYRFEDRYGEKCSLQESSLATEAAIWFGVNDPVPKVCVQNEGWVPITLPPGALVSGRMHLTQDQVRQLLPMLQHFAEHGTLTHKTLTPPAAEGAGVPDLNNIIGNDGQEWPQTFDGMAWATAFNRQFPSVSVDDALSWFCNAIMRGYDTHAQKQPAPVVACSACHGEREVSEHECCGNSTNGECCGQSVEVRVPCLFCSGTLAPVPPVVTDDARDAARYRWLKQNAPYSTLYAIAWSVVPAAREFTTPDECIDAALQHAASEVQP